MFKNLNVHKVENFGQNFLKLKIKIKRTKDKYHRNTTHNANQISNEGGMIIRIHVYSG